MILNLERGGPTRPATPRFLRHHLLVRGLPGWHFTVCGQECRMNKGHPSRVRVWLVVAGVVTVLLAALEVVGDYRTRVHGAGGAAWDSPAIADGLTRVDEALAAKDTAAAVRAWRDARAAALGRGGWQSMVALGDASLRIGDGAEFRRGFTAGARESYHNALFRARDERSVEGVLRTAQAFAALG